MQMADLQSIHSVLILGASGGVGSMAVQLADIKGAEVIGVASEKNQEYMEKLGADHTIDYNGNHVGEAVKKEPPGGFDLIFDFTSGETLQQSLNALKPTGKLVSILNRGENLDSDINHEYLFVVPNSLQLEHMADLFEEDELTMHVSETYTLEEAGQALEDIQSLHTRG